MELLSAAGYRHMRWKNGGGETIEIAVSPVAAPLDEFDWRISMAIVAGDGPFSLFPEVDRTLTILDGEGVRLGLDGGRTRLELTQDSAPCSFPADIGAEARLIGGPVTDLNVMTRRGRYRHQVRRVPVNGVQVIETTAAATAAVFCCKGEVACTAPEGSALLLREHDCALLRAPRGRLELISRRPATVILVEFYRTTE